MSGVSSSSIAVIVLAVHTPILFHRVIGVPRTRIQDPLGPRYRVSRGGYVHGLAAAPVRVQSTS